MRTTQIGSLKKIAVKVPFLALVFTANAFSQETETAYVPFVVNADAVVTALPPDSYVGATTVQIAARADKVDTLIIPLQEQDIASISHRPQRRANAPLTVRYSRGNISLKLHPQSYGNAEISLFTVNGKRIMRYTASASKTDGANISIINIAAGVYLLSVKGANGNSFAGRITHHSGNLNINTAFGNETFSLGDENALYAAAATGYGTWTITVGGAAGYRDTAYPFIPIAGLNPLQNIILRAATPTDMPRYILPSKPNYGNNVSVHDPSIFKDDDGKYYTFGSHFDVANSTDLIRWTQNWGGGDNQKAANLYGSNPVWQTTLAAAFEHVGTDNNNNPPPSTWAPDVIKINGKYYMYYSLSLFGSNKSYIGRVESDNITGPYSNSVEVVKTPAGGGSSPNAIDPAIFYDKEGRLWMSYGSFFNGIYIFEMETSGARLGLPKTGQGNYGKRIWNGNNGPEGPYIFYNPEIDYYYLMVSHGSLSEDYNMRAARSKNPDGPYLDIRGRDAGSVNASGNKLAGNYKFAGASRGYAALGHNSVLKEGGKYFVIYHTRYQSGATGVSGNHNQFVNQLFFNKDGWPVMAPNRYAGESAGRVDAEDIAGEYDIVIHTPVGNDAAFVNSSVYSFTADGGVRRNNAVCGDWSRAGDYYFSVTIDGAAYDGVMVPQYNNDLDYAALSFTGVSNEGTSMWANKKNTPP